jgi:hypothetical protein
MTVIASGAKQSSGFAGHEGQSQAGRLLRFARKDGGACSFSECLVEIVFP